MSEPIWDKFLTERDKQVFAAAGFGARQGFGKRPALLIIDVNYDFCGDRPEPILQSIKRWRASCGEEAWESVKVIRRLLAAGRTKNLPVIYTTGIRRLDNWDSGSWSWKNTRTDERVSTRVTNLPGDTIVPDIARRVRAGRRRGNRSAIPPPRVATRAAAFRSPSSPRRSGHGRATPSASASASMSSSSAITTS